VALLAAHHVDEPGLGGPGGLSAATRPVPGAGATRTDRTARVAAALMLLAGLLNLASVLVPRGRPLLELLDAIVPGAISEGATALTAASGIGLVLLSGGLRRHRRSAYLATLALLGCSAVLHLIKGLDLGAALLEAFLAGILVARGEDFTARLGPGERAPLLLPALAVPVATIGYGMLGLLVNQGDVATDLGPRALLEQAARMALGLGASVPLHGRFGRAFPASVAAVLFTGMAFLLARLLAPASRPGGASPRRSGSPSASGGPDADEPRLAALAAASDDSLAYFALREDRATVAAGEALVSYRGVGTVALAAGDPLGPPQDWPVAIAAFRAEAVRQGRVAAAIGCGAEAAARYADAGLRSLYLGDEAVIDLDAFSLDGRPMRIVRQSWNRAKRAGLSCQIARSGELDAATRSELAAISARWRGGTAERGFSMALGRLFDPRDAAAIVVAGRAADGRALGFLHLVPWGPDGASLDVMRREPGAPAILNDFLIAEAAMRLCALGVRRMSLNFSFLRAVLEAGAVAKAPLAPRLGCRLLRRLSGPFQIESLYHFNKKFRPRWEPRYLACEAMEDLPRVALAALRAEGLLARPARGVTAPSLAPSHG
jgi:lysyl-tRNA synthetase, class II